MAEEGVEGEEGRVEVESSIRFRREIMNNIEAN